MRYLITTKIFPSILLCILGSTLGPFSSSTFHFILTINFQFILCKYPESLKREWKASNHHNQQQLKSIHTKLLQNQFHNLFSSPFSQKLHHNFSSFDYFMKRSRRGKTKREKKAEEWWFYVRVTMKLSKFISYQQWLPMKLVLWKSKTKL